MASSDLRPVSAPPRPQASGDSLPLDARPPRESLPVAPPAPVDERHQLPAHRGKIGRVTDHARGLVDDLTEWAELRIALVQQEVKEKVEENKTKGTYGGIIGLFAALGGLFMLLAFGFGASAVFAIWVSQFVALLLGFLSLSLLLFLVAFVAYKKSPFDTKESE